MTSPLGIAPGSASAPISESGGTSDSGSIAR